jgi:hypothetical protein
MRDGIEYEFDVCGEIDQENTLIITKSRCPKLTGGVFLKPGKEVAEILKEWLDGPPPPPTATLISSSPTPARGENNSNGSAALNGSVPLELAAIWKRMCSPRGVVAEFAKLHETLLQAGGAKGESEYQEILSRHGVDGPGQFKSSQPARLCAKEVFQAIQTIADMCQHPGNGLGKGDTPVVLVDERTEMQPSGGQNNAD